MRRRDLLPSLLLSAAVVACVVRPDPETTTSGAPPGGPQDPAAAGRAGDPGAAAVAGEVTVEEITDDTGKIYKVSQGVRGEPGALGCADGQREAFVDTAAFPGIAGCLSTWAGTQSMRAPATGAPCGDDRGECAVPADVCATGWHVCGAKGALADLRQVSAEQCEQAGGGRFSAGVSHCETQSGCEYDTRPAGDYECFPSGWCSETVCCGNDCGEFGACTDGVWPGKTHIAQGTDQGCGATSSRRAGGVLCCQG